MTTQIQLDAKSIQCGLDFLERAQNLIAEVDSTIIKEMGFALNRALVFKLLFRQIKNLSKAKRMENQFQEMRENIKKVAQNMLLERSNVVESVENTNAIEFMLAKKVRSQLNSSIFNLQKKENSAS